MSTHSAKPPAMAAAQTPTELSVAVVGISTDSTCGVRDHAELLARALPAADMPCSLNWLLRTPARMAGARAQVGSWSDRLRSELVRDRPDIVLVHYSVFAFSHRGVPVFVPPVMAAIRAAQAPLVVVMHEYAYPWGMGGLRGTVWASAQRLALAEVIRSASAVVVTADARAEWLRKRPWLPRRETSVAAVFSNLPAPVAPARRLGADTIGLFGYAHEGVAVEIVLDAVADLRRRGLRTRLALLGAPGRPSPAATRWERAAQERGVCDQLVFSGKLDPQELSNALACCDALLFAELGGPTSRKTTLAASLSSGRPVVALDGPNSWSELVDARAARIVAPNADSLADAVSDLLGDPQAGERQGKSGRAFAAASMSLERSARVVASAITMAAARAVRPRLNDQPDRPDLPGSRHG